MRRISVTTLLILVVSVFFGSAGTRAEEHPPLSNLVMRDRIITIKNSPNGLSYTVRTQDGTVLDAQLNEAQLQAKYPEVYDTVRPAIANSEKTGGSMIWGGIQHVPSDVLR
ncbi:hypothetical protein SD80_019095 [Scytonema tolypothrichoides VB-61278]|nr:hypothetical protein SD80_019095 [Scytonema tolypothrichoides VB-61278]